MAAKKKPPTEDLKNPTDDEIRLMQRVAKTAGDAELERLCEAALKNYATSREAILREIAHGPHAEAYKQAVLDG